jgi:hypothetical protein
MALPIGEVLALLFLAGLAAAALVVAFRATRSAGAPRDLRIEPADGRELTNVDARRLRRALGRLG